MTHEEFREKLGEAVKECGGRKAMAERYGVARSYITMVLNGTVMPGPKILAILGLPADTFAGVETPATRRRRLEREAKLDKLAALIRAHFREHKAPISGVDLAAAAGLGRSEDYIYKLLHELARRGDVEKRGGRWVPASKHECVLCGCPK